MEAGEEQARVPITGERTLDVIGFGSLNLDEMWEVSAAFLRRWNLIPGEEYVRDVDWFRQIYPELRQEGSLKAVEPGGSAANAIAALRRMGFRTGYVGAAGLDEVGNLRLSELGEPEHLRITMTDRPAGRCLALLNVDDPARDRSLVILPNANDLAGCEPEDDQFFLESRWVHLTSFVASAPLEAQMRLVERISGRVRVSFDPGAVYAAKGLAGLKRIVSRSDLVFVSVEELHRLCGSLDTRAAVSELLGLGVRVVVVKLGAQGIEAHSHDGRVHCPAVPVARVLDRTGAGDVAAAGFLVGMLKSAPLHTCLNIAAMAAARSIKGYGRSTYPDRRILMEM
ncbi:MAG: carbohydrate kinase family protein [Thermodesulfobacteriota bacterium]